MEKNLAAQLTALFQGDSNGRRLSAADGHLIDAATGFLASAIEAIADVGNSAIDKLEGLTGDKLSEALNVFNKEVNIENSWGDFGNGAFINEIKEAQSLAEATALYDAAEAELCEPLNYTLPEKVPTECEGPTIKLEYKPKTCIVEEHLKEIECKPAKLVLTKYPGKCTLKHHSPFEFIDKDCKQTTEFAWHDTTVTEKGGQEYTLFIDQHNITLPTPFH